MAVKLKLYEFMHVGYNVTFQNMYVTSSAHTSVPGSRYKKKKKKSTQVDLLSIDWIENNNQTWLHT